MKLGRKHAVGLAMDMPGRVAAEYRAAGAAAGAPEIRDFDAEVSIRKRTPVHVDAGSDSRESEVYGTRFL